MPENASKNEVLRQQALRWLETAKLEDKAAPPVATTDPAVMLEELRIYQAELEVQNEELRLGRQESETARNYYSSLFNLLPILAFVLDDLGLIVEANHKASAVFGFSSRVQLRQHSIYRLLEEGSATLLAESLRNSSEDQVQVDFDLLRVRGADGQIHVMTGNLACLPDAGGRKPHCLLLLVDRTAEFELNARLRLYRTIVNQTKSSIFANDAELRNILINDTAAALIGLPREAILGRRRQEYALGQQGVLYDAHDLEVWQSGKAMIFEESFDSADGRRTYFLAQRFPLYDDDGHMIAVGGISTDITEIKNFSRKQELALRVFGQGSDGIVIADGEGQIESVNGAFKAITGIPEAEAVGMSMLQFGSSRYSPAFIDNLTQHVETTGNWEGELWVKGKSGDDIPVWLRISKVGFDGGAASYYVCSFADLRQRKLADQEIERLAFHDQLTGLANRYLLRDRMEQLLRYCSRSGTGFWVAFFDLDHFKSVNDDHGHEAGDFVLNEVARRLTAHARESDTLARLGGDEFVWVAEDVPFDVFSTRLTTVLRDLAMPYVHGKDSLNLSASVGVANFPTDGADFDTLMNNADLAMYGAKENGGNAVRFFNSQMGDDLHNRHHMENRLRGAIDRGDFTLVYQPQVRFDTLEITGVEALLRWRDADLGHTTPDLFIPVAERMGLLDPIGDWVLDQVCQQLQAWRAQGLGDITVSINVSARQFFQPDFVARIRGALTRHAIAGNQIEIELTERVAMENARRSIEIMRALKAEGIRLAIDDFGTGYSSLAYLRWMPVDVLKIDQSFVNDIGVNRDEEIICQSIIDLAKALSLTVLAEGVETETQFAFLKQAGCDLAQGFLLSRPLAAADVLPFIQTKGRRRPDHA